MKRNLIARMALLATYINTLRLRRCARQLRKLKKSLVELQKIEKNLGNL